MISNCFIFFKKKKEVPRNIYPAQPVIKKMNQNEQKKTTGVEAAHRNER